jgi:hypothetical protein
MVTDVSESDWSKIHKLFPACGKNRFHLARPKSESDIGASQ